MTAVEFIFQRFPSRFGQRFGIRGEFQQFIIGHRGIGVGEALALLEIVGVQHWAE